MSPPGSIVNAVPTPRTPARPRAALPAALDAADMRLVLRSLLFDGGSVPAWHGDAACAGQPRARLFAALDHGRPRAAAVRAAKRVCESCPVRDTCLDDGMAHEPVGARHGVFGGLSPAQRHDLHRSTSGTPS